MVVMTVAFRDFVPITAAGQRGIFTPLPSAHPLDIAFLPKDGVVVKPKDRPFQRTSKHLATSSIPATARGLRR
jgi:hypothetical protein